jgi:hypothetical protein
MSVEEELELGGFDLDATTLLGVAVVVLVVGLLVSLKQLFGSYNIFRVIEEYKEKKKIDESYSRLFQTRENLCFHIGWARSRGESPSEIRRMVEELKAVDRAIDETEAPRRRLLAKKDQC